METTLKVKALDARIGKEIPLPYYATGGSAGMDLHACIENSMTLAPMESAVIPTGIAIGLPSCDYVGLVFARSGLAIKYGIALSNGVGVIDSDYTGEVRVGVVNLSQNSYTMNPGDRIAQLAVVPVCHAAVRLVDNLEDTSRGDGGFGSTGK